MDNNTINECLWLLNTSEICTECKSQIYLRLIIVQKIMQQDKFNDLKWALFAEQQLEILLCEMQRAWMNPKEMATISKILEGAEAILAVVGANAGAGASSESG